MPHLTGCRHRQAGGEPAPGKQRPYIRIGRILREFRESSKEQAGNFLKHPQLGELGQEDDRRTALLSALRPFVKKERYAKLDRAIQIARLSRVIRTAFRFFQEEGQGRV